MDTLFCGRNDALSACMHVTSLQLQAEIGPLRLTNNKYKVASENDFENFIIFDVLLTTMFI